MTGQHQRRSGCRAKRDTTLGCLSDEVDRFLKRINHLCVDLRKAVLEKSVEVLPVVHFSEFS